MIKKQHYLKVDLVNCCDSVLPKNLKKKMEDFVNFISKINLAKGYRNRELESFTEKFVEKYGEYVEVPIKDASKKFFNPQITKTRSL